jgi:hypothetical protein
LYEGELVIIPKGIKQKLVANEETHIMIIELKGTINTGNVQNERIKAENDYI